MSWQDHYHHGPRAIPYPKPVPLPTSTPKGDIYDMDIYHSHERGQEPHTHAPADTAHATLSTYIPLDEGEKKASRP